MIIGGLARKLASMRKRLLVLGVAAAALLGATAMPAAADPLPAFDFADCPTIPAGADPAQWRCEVLISHGTAKIGRLPELTLPRIKTTFAEGRLNGSYAQVFGAMRADPVWMRGNRLQLEYAGFADFLSVGDRMGEQHLKLAVRAPWLPRTCTIGSDEDPIVFKPVRTGPTEVVSPDPLVLRFSIRDNEFAVPGAHGCGPLSKVVEHRFGVPAASGTNSLELTTYVSIRGYGKP
jgi:hypothetical protein